MGTSISNSGPGKTPLLPDWYEPVERPEDDDGPKEEDERDADETEQADSANPVPEVLDGWGPAKSSLTRFTGDRSKGGLKRAAKSYIGSYGGSKKAASTAISGKKAAISLFGFVSNVSKKGIIETAKDYGIDSFDGLGTKQVFSLLSNELAPDGDTPEAAIARAAITETMCDVLKEVEASEGDLSNIDDIIRGQENQFVIKYLSNYIFFRWVHELGETLEKKDISATELINIESEMKIFITNSLSEKWKRYDLEGTDFKNPLGIKLINDVFEQAYSIIESI